MPTLLRMPAVAAGAETAILAEWQVQQDVPFQASDVIATVETDKAMVEIEAEEPGVILRFLVGSGEQVEVGAAIALSGAPGETIDDIDGALRDLGVTAPPPALAQAEALPASQTQSTVGAEEPPSGRVLATPLVRRLAEDANLDLATVSGTGPNGRIVRRDVEQLLSGTPAPSSPTKPEDSAEAPAPAAADGGDTGFDDVPHSRIRAAIATRLTESKRTVPHFYVRGICRVDRLLAMRSELNANAEQAGRIKLSVNDLVVKAAARAHTVVPAMNVIWTEQAIRRFDAVDVGVAMATERGLVTPVVRDVARRSLISVSADLRDLADRAQKGKLAQREIEGGTFCISNLGMFGTQDFSAIINPPQSAILAVGAAVSEPVVEDGELAVGTVMRVTLSVDHRPIDGSTAAEWMQAFVGIIENPLQILV